ncbi:MAG: serine/threonine-protein kinase, partial [Phycisphaerales bacterium]|nr:serine/threonine-protein kinase [Phycisphaerales bacterium]
MLLTVLGRSPETRERWITSHAATPGEADELRAMLRIAAADEAPGATDPLIGAACGPWILTQRLGDGGQGVVYEAERDDDPAAVKVLREGGDTETAFKLERETTALAAIDHPGIAALRGSGVADIGGQRRSWIAMDLIPAAEPLLDWAALHQPSMDERVGIITQIAVALAAAHEAGVIHRDLKSSNVLVGDDNQPRIIDLGIARVLGESHLARTHTAERHALVGTLESLAPEQVDGRLGSVSEQTDIYALGVLAYRLLAGEVPYDTGASIVSAAQAILHVPPVPPDVFNKAIPPGASAAIMRALQKRPEDRWPSMRAFATAISGAAASETSTEPRPRRRGLVLAASAVIAITATVAVWLSVSGQDQQPPHGAGGGGV